MIKCVVVSHGEVASGLVASCERILGECEHVYALQCRGLSRPQVQQQIEALIETENLHEGLLILVSLYGGSFWQSAVHVAGKHRNVEVISGVNLSLLISFVTKRSQYSLKELPDVLLNDAVRAIRRN